MCHRGMAPHMTWSLCHQAVNVCGSGCFEWLKRLRQLSFGSFFWKEYICHQDHWSVCPLHVRISTYGRRSPGALKLWCDPKLSSCVLSPICIEAMTFGLVYFFIETHAFSCSTTEEKFGVGASVLSRSQAKEMSNIVNFRLRICTSHQRLSSQGHCEYWSDPLTQVLTLFRHPPPPPCECLKTQTFIFFINGGN